VPRPDKIKTMEEGSGSISDPSALSLMHC
jgi:hypothetical protein